MKVNVINLWTRSFPYFESTAFWMLPFNFFQSHQSLSSWLFKFAPFKEWAGKSCAPYQRGSLSRTWRVPHLWGVSSNHKQTETMREARHWRRRDSFKMRSLAISECLASPWAVIQVSQKMFTMWVFRNEVSANILYMTAYLPIWEIVWPFLLCGQTNSAYIDINFTTLKKVK